MNVQTDRQTERQYKVYEYLINVKVEKRKEGHIDRPIDRQKDSIKCINVQLM
jgi:hypothetical protein